MKKLKWPILILAVTVLICGLSIGKVLSKISYGIDLQGGFEILYRVEPLVEGNKVTSEDLEETYKAIVKRIDTLGVSEPVITIEGDNLIRVQLPGEEDEETARSRMGTPAVLTFRDTDDKLLLTSDILSNKAVVNQDTKTLGYEVVLGIDDIEKFYNVTKDLSERKDGTNLMVIWLDFEEGKDSYKEQGDACGKDGNMKCISAAYVNDALGSNSVSISGSFTQEQAQNLAELINSGALPTKLVEEATPKSVSPSFGSETITKTGIAGLITFVIISLILIFKYRFSGLVGSICLFAYILLVFLLFNAVDGVLTLTGIAALVLGIGMAVDSIIISNERVKDELTKNSKLNVSYKEGSKNSLTAIIDANITTLIAGIVLYAFGESSVRGFATVLIITIFVTIFTCVILYRWIISLSVKSGSFKDHPIALFGNNKNKKEINYVKIAKYPLIASGVIVLLGACFVLFKGFNFGVDFTGGTNIVLSSEKDIDFDKVKEIVKDYDVRDYDYYIGTKSEGYIKLNDILDEETEIKVKKDIESLGISTSVSEISNLVTKSLTKNAIKALIYSLVAIIIYVAIRFNINYAITGILMLMHDVLIILACFAVFNISVDFIIVAALLTIIGYSINDTIVVFDRIRENRTRLYRSKKRLSKEELTNLVNTSSIQTVNRNVWTSITTIVSVVTLICVGLNDIITFNTAILIGLCAGTVSSLLIGPRIWMALEKKSMDRPEDEDDDEIEELKVKGINS